MWYHSNNDVNKLCEQTKPKFEIVRTGTKEDPTGFKLETIYYTLNIEQTKLSKFPFFEPVAQYRGPFEKKHEVIIKYYNLYEKEFIFENYAFFHSILIGINDY